MQVLFAYLDTDLFYQYFSSQNPNVENNLVLIIGYDKVKSYSADFNKIVENFLLEISVSVIDVLLFLQQELLWEF